MAYTPPRYTQAVVQSSKYFPCGYCKGPLGADSKGHCAGCGAPRQAMPPLFNAAVLPQQRTFEQAYPEMSHWFSEQQNLGNRQPTGLENAFLRGFSGLGSGGRW